MRKVTLVLMAAAVFSVCQTGYTGRYLNVTVIRFDSSPQSALVTCGGAQKGYTPVDVRLDINYRIDGKIELTPCIAKWVSGAQSSYKTIIDGRETTVNRPKYSNIYYDNNFDYQRKKDIAEADESKVRQKAADTAAEEARREATAALARREAADYEARRDAAAYQARQEAAAYEAKQEAAKVAREAESQRDYNEAWKNFGNWNKTTTCYKIGFQTICN